MFYGTTFYRTVTKIWPNFYFYTELIQYISDLFIYLGNDQVKSHEH